MDVRALFLALAASLSLVLGAVTLEAGLSNVEYDDFLKSQMKNYDNVNEYLRRQSIFESNKKMVQWLNSRNDDDAHYELNHLADIEPQEFLMSHKGDDGPVFEPKDYLPKLPTHGLPENFDWRDKGAVSPVKNQGQLGSCWAFSAAANIEGQMFMKTKDLVSLSVEQLVECDNSDCGAYGGWPHYAYEYVKNNGGLVAWDDLPYCAGDGSCSPCMARHYNKTTCGDHSDLYCDTGRDICKKMKKHETKGWVSKWGVVPENEEQIKAALVKYGPLSVAIDATMLQFYSRGIWNPFFCSRQLNHALLIVGYGVEHGRPYWTVKNSWGENWGMDGYFKMVRGKDLCGFTISVTSAFYEE